MMKNSEHYLIKYDDRYLGIRYDKQTFLNIHDGTSDFKIENTSGKTFLKSKNDKYISEGSENEIVLTPEKTGRSALTVEASADNHTVFLKFDSGNYVMGSRYELRHSPDKTDKNKITLLRRENLNSDIPEKMIWASDNTESLTPPDPVIQARGFAHKAPTAGVFNWILNHFGRWLDYLQREDTRLREDHEQLDAYVRDWFLERNDDVSDAIRQARDARDNAVIAQNNASASAGDALSSENKAAGYAASALSSKNEASQSSATATAKATETAETANIVQELKDEVERLRNEVAGLKNSSVQASERSEASSVTSGSHADRAGIHAKNARQDFTSLSTKITNHETSVRDKFDLIELINHQQASGRFNLTRESINRDGSWTKDLVATGGSCFFRFWLKITEYHLEYFNWVEKHTHGVEFTVVTRPNSNPWNPGSTNSISVNGNYGIRNVLEHLNYVFQVYITDTHIGVKAHKDQMGWLETRVRQNKRKFAFSWHTLG